MKKLLIITSLFLILAQGFAQENTNTEEVTVEEAQTESKGLMKELFMFQMAKDVLETRQLISDNELGENVEKFMFDYSNSALFFISELKYDFFWNSVLGRKKYKVPSSQLFLDSKDKVIEENRENIEFRSIDFDVFLTPQWEDPAKEDKVKDYKVEIIPKNFENFDLSLTQETGLYDKMNSVLKNAGNPTSPNKAEVNKAIFDGFDYLRSCLTVSPSQILDIKLFTQKFLPGTEEEKFNLEYEIKESNLAKIEKVRMEVFKKTDDGDKVIYTSDDITDFTKDFTWDGQLASGENQEVSYVTYTDNPLYARVVATEADGVTSYKAETETEFKVKGNLLDVSSISEIFDLKNNEAIQIEYTLEQIEDAPINYGKYEVLDKEDNVVATGELDFSELEDIEDGKYKKGQLTWPESDDINEFVSKIVAEKNPYQIVLKVSGDEEFSTESTYKALANSEVIPEIVKISSCDEEFASLIKPLTGEGLKIEYEIVDIKKYEIKYAKLEVYKPNSTIPSFVVPLLKNGTKINSEDQLTENEFKGKYVWLGKMNQAADNENFIERVEDEPFKVVVVASNTEDYKRKYKSIVNSNVDEYSKEWNKYPELHVYVELLNEHPEKNRYRRYITLHPIYKDFLRTKGINLSRSNPIEYLAQNTEPISFLNQNIIVHKNFKPVLEDIENQMGNHNIKNYYNQLGHYKNKLGHLSIRLMRKTTTNRLSNHGFGFAIDVDAINNPYINGPQFCRFVALATGEDIYNKNLTAEATMNVIDALITKFTEVTLSDLLSHLNAVRTNLTDGTLSIVEIDSHDFNTWANDIYNAYKTLLIKAKQNNATESECDAIRGLINDYVEKLVRLENGLDAYKKGLFLTEVSGGVVIGNAFEEFDYFNEFVDKISKDFYSIETVINKISSSIISQRTFSVADYPADDLLSYIDFDEIKMNTLIDKIESKLNILGGKENFNDYFVDYISNNINKGHKLNNIIVNGFLGLEIEFINMFLYDYNPDDIEKTRRENMEWGGEWGNPKDYMHFELNPQTY